MNRGTLWDGLYHRTQSADVTRQPVPSYQERTAGNRYGRAGPDNGKLHTETARHVVRNSAENFTVTTLELGGGSPIVVLDDVDIDCAGNGLIAGNLGASRDNVFIKRS